MAPSERCAILIVSCDKYSDIWQPFFTLFGRFWPDCPLPVYFLANKLSLPLSMGTMLLSGEDLSWSDSLGRALAQIPQEYVFLFLDDLFLHDFVNTSEITELFEWGVRNRVNYLRLRPVPPPDLPCNEDVGLISRSGTYRTSTVLSLWRKECLQALLRAGETAWQFERAGSIRSAVHDKFYCSWRNYFAVINGLIRGRWHPDAIRKLKSLDVKLNLSRRPVMTMAETALFNLRLIRWNLFQQVPSRYRERVWSMSIR